MDELTVGELIERLRKLDPELKVIVTDYDGGDHCERFVSGAVVKNRNDVNFGSVWKDSKLVPAYTPSPTERFVHIVWNE